ncbi:hypothetical protein ACHQM5_022809 [Ranunculus cassubicifolius]
MRFSTSKLLIAIVFFSVLLLGFMQHNRSIALSDGVTINGGISVRRKLQRILPTPPSPVGNMYKHEDSGKGH